MGENRDYVTQVDEQGSIHISEDVLGVIAAAAAMEVEGVSSITANLGADLAELLGKKNQTRGIRIQMVDDSVQVELSILVKYGYAVHDVARAVQDAVFTNIESMSGLTVGAVNINVSGVTFDREAPKTK